jgi:general nucleoside transport system ATP-binding protein
VSAASPILSLDNIGKIFGPVAALSGVSLSVESGQVHALLGENGAGKSTLCNVIFGVQQPDSGAMTLEGKRFRPSGPGDSLNAGVAMVHQHFSVVSSMTVVENLMLGRVRGALRRRQFATQILNISQSYGLEIEPHRRIDELSVGERQRVEIIKCLMRNPRLLILDEPTAVLPPTEINAFLSVCRQVANAGCGVVLVTHKLAEITRIADWVTVLRAGSVADSAPMAANSMGKFVRAMVQKDIDALDTTLAASVGVGASTPSKSEADRPPASRKGGKNALTIDAVSFEDRQGVRRLEEITIEVRGGEIVGLAGVEGNGQTELGAILAGLEAPSSGRIFVDETDITGAKAAQVTRAGVGIVPEDRQAVGCILPMTIAENLFLNNLKRFTRFGMLQRAAMGRATETLMQQYDIRASGPRAPMATLSGGNQQKAVLARELSTDGLVFLLAAQPTRGLDIGALAAVYERIREARDRGVGVLLVSSELDELISVADRILVIFRGRIVGEQPASHASREAIGRLMAGEPSERAAA